MSHLPQYFYRRGCRATGFVLWVSTTPNFALCAIAGAINGWRAAQNSKLQLSRAGRQHVAALTSASGAIPDTPPEWEPPSQVGLRPVTVLPPILTGTCATYRNVAHLDSTCHPTATGTSASSHF